jgi:hypothetical protein
MFNTLHLMFEAQYTELALAVDLVAERIRALGYPAPGTYSAYAKLTSIKEPQGVPSATDMIRQLVEGQEAVTRTARSIFPAVEAPRRADCRPADAAHAGARKERLDAAQPARKLSPRHVSPNRPAGAGFHFGTRLRERISAAASAHQRNSAAALSRMCDGKWAPRAICTAPARTEPPASPASAGLASAATLSTGSAASHMNAPAA